MSDYSLIGQCAHCGGNLTNGHRCSNSTMIKSSEAPSNTPRTDALLSKSSYAYEVMAKMEIELQEALGREEGADALHEAEKLMHAKTKEQLAAAESENKLLRDAISHLRTDMGVDRYLNNLLAPPSPRSALDEVLAKERERICAAAADLAYTMLDDAVLAGQGYATAVSAAIRALGKQFNLSDSLR